MYSHSMKSRAAKLLARFALLRSCELHIGIEDQEMIRSYIDCLSFTYHVYS